MGGRAALTGEAEPMTAQYNAIGAMLAAQWPTQPEAVAVRTWCLCLITPLLSDTLLGDEKLNQHVTVRIYSPSRVPPGQSLPVGLYFHGGGYIAGNLELEDPMCRIISDQVPCVIVSVDYRLAPEHKLPAAVDDGYDAYLWVCSPQNPYLWVLRLISLGLRPCRGLKGGSRPLFCNGWFGWGERGICSQ